LGPQREAHDGKTWLLRHFVTSQTTAPGHAVLDVLIHQGGGRVRAGEGVGAVYGAMAVIGEEPTQLTLGQVQLLVGVTLSVLTTLLTSVAGSGT